MLICCLQVNSQDIKMSYMQVSWKFGYTYSDTTYLLTDINNNVFRPYILINWGVKIDTSKLIQTTLTNNGYLKKYYGTCAFPGPGYYFISYQDSYRVANIKNILLSSSQSFKLSNLLNIQIFGSSVNSAPIIGNRTITLSLQNDSVIFKPQFYDINGDSLSFQITPCFASNYYIPNGILINAHGDLSFSKDSLGIYAFSLIIKEWRKNSDSVYVNIQASQIDFTMDITSTVGIREFFKENENILIYPNPTNSILTLVDKQNQLQTATISITNTLGEIVLFQNFASQIDLSNLASGMYYLTVQNGIDKKIIKVVKQ